MKRLATLWILGMIAFQAQAETILICHTQSVPTALETNFHSSLSTEVVDKVFDYYFKKGDIAFDASCPQSEGTPSVQWLANLQSQYGADKLVFVQMVWKSGDKAQAVLDRIDYRVVALRGQVLTEGSLNPVIVSPSNDESKAVDEAADLVVKGLAS